MASASKKIKLEPSMKKINPAPPSKMIKLDLSAKEIKLEDDKTAVLVNGIFPFLLLPAELRYMIYQYLVGYECSK